MIQKFFCEECGKEFDEYREAMDHETECFSLKKRQEVELDKVQTFLERNYADQLKNVVYSVNENTLSTDDHIQRFVTFVFEVEIFDGKIIISDKDIETGTLIMADIILKKIISEIELLSPQEFEGIISDNYGYGNSIGNISLDSICSWLEGKKVRLEVID